LGFGLANPVRTVFQSFWHGLAGSADSGFIRVIASQEEMADAMGFCVE
jgi:hypothetical protein